MGCIKAIETEYNGYRFRSRLEARWAVFFDALGVRYEYEPEGFELPDGRYLPDFYLPDIRDGVYIEVKGEMDESSYRKVQSFWKHGSKPLYILGGLPTQEDLDQGDMYQYVERYNRCFEIGFPDGSGDWPYLFCVCPACGKVGLEFDGRGWRVCGVYHKDKSLSTNTYKDSDGATHHFAHPEVAGWRTDDKGYSWNQSKIVAAYKKARQARFEYGETPQPTLNHKPSTNPKERR